MKQITDQDIHEEIIYYFYCPECGEQNNLDSEPCGGEQLNCDHCDVDIEFNYKVQK